MILEKMIKKLYELNILSLKHPEVSHLKLT